MHGIQEKIIEKFGNKIRVRVCGICTEGDKILLVNHHSLNQKKEFWAPPGGGMEFGTSAKENLKREFLEETGLKIEIEKFLFVHEYLHTPLHAVELIFKVKKIGGKLKIGFDPEMEEREQIIRDVKFIPIKEVSLKEKDTVHQMFDELSRFSGSDESLTYSLFEKS